MAVNLGLCPGTIDSIAGDFSKNRDCLNEAVLAWLHHKHNYRRKGLPTWRTLAKAVEPINCALAKKLLDRHLGTLINKTSNSM